MQLERIHNDAPKVPELVMESLLDALEKGQIKVGEDLPPERDLAITLGVGRGSLRECLAVLEFLGVIENRGNRKVIVKDARYVKKAVSFLQLSDRGDITEDFQEFRRTNEIAIAQLACDRATEKDLNVLADLVEQMQKDHSNYMADIKFHNALARCSHNPIYVAMMDLITCMIADLWVRYHELPEHQERTAESHRQIYLAVKNHDKKKAKSEVAHHMQLVEDFMRESAGKEDN